MPIRKLLYLGAWLSSALVSATSVRAGTDEAAAMAVAPRIMVSGVGEVAAPAAKASFSIGITISLASAAAASAEAGSLSKAVTEALDRVGLKKSERVATHLTVNPQFQYDTATHQNRRTAYEAKSMLDIEMTDLARLGLYLDTALTAGATDISEIRYTAADPASLRHEALALAVAHARADAQVMAQAAGGTLGSLIELSTEPAGNRSRFGLEEVVMTARKVAGPSDTEIIPSRITTSTSVLATWRYVAGSSTP